MSFKHVASNTLHCLRIGLASLALFQFSLGASLAGAAPVPAPAPAQEASSAPATTSPIKHVIVIIGENRSFDHVFATYARKAIKRSGTCSRKKSSTPTALRAPTFTPPSKAPPPTRAPLLRCFPAEPRPNPNSLAMFSRLRWSAVPRTPTSKVTTCNSRKLPKTACPRIITSI